MNILVVAPHPDDEAIGCGGAACLHIARGDRVVTAFLTSGELGLKHLPEAEARRIREEEATAAARILGTAEPRFLHLPDWEMGDDVDLAAAALRPVIELERPGRIYLPHPADDHPDHRASHPIVVAALASWTETPPELRGYEVWSPLGEFDIAEDISAVMPTKLDAVRCYRSQTAQFAYDRAAAGLGQYRGALAGRCAYAEVFRILPVGAVTGH